MKLREGGTPVSIHIWTRHTKEGGSAEYWQERKSPTFQTTLFRSSPSIHFVCTFFFPLLHVKYSDKAKLSINTSARILAPFPPHWRLVPAPPRITISPFPLVALGPLSTAEGKVPQVTPSDTNMNDKTPYLINQSPGPSSVLSLPLPQDCYAAKAPG